MKLPIKHHAVLLAVVTATACLMAGCGKTDSQKISSDIKTTAQDTATATKNTWDAGKDKVVEAATNTTKAVKNGAQKAGEVATNVAAKVKSATSNAWNDTKSVTTNTVNKLDGLIH